MNNLQQLQTQLARLESTHDHLNTEVDHVNDLLKKIGFKNGLETLKSAADSLTPKEYPNESEEDS
jgi:prefoldin subunit 5